MRYRSGTPVVSAVLPLGTWGCLFGHLDLSLPTGLVTLSIVTCPSRWFLRTGGVLLGRCAAPVQRYFRGFCSTRLSAVRVVDVPRDIAGSGVRLCTEQAVASERSEMAVLLGQSPARCDARGPAISDR